jgi:hypothetical protein
MTDTDTYHNGAYWFSTVADVASALSGWRDADTSADGHVFSDACHAVWRAVEYAPWRGQWAVSGAKARSILAAYLG